MNLSGFKTLPEQTRGKATEDAIARAKAQMEEKVAQATTEKNGYGRERG